MKKQKRILRKIIVYVLCLGMAASQLSARAETLPYIGPQIGPGTAREETTADGSGAVPEQIEFAGTDPVETTEEPTEEPEPETEPEQEPAKQETESLSVSDFLSMRNSNTDSRQTLDLVTERGDNTESSEGLEYSLLLNRRMRRMAEVTELDLVVFRGNGWLNVRAEADANSPLVGKMYYDDTAEIKGKTYTENGVWFYIVSGNVTGYIKSEYVLSGYDAAAVISESNTRFAYIINDSQRVFRYGDSESDVIGAVYGGQKYQIDWIGDYYTCIVYAAEGNSNVLFGFIPNSSYELVWDLQTAISVEEENANIDDMLRIRRELESIDESREESRRIESSIRQSEEDARAAYNAWLQASIAESRRVRESQEAEAAAAAARAAAEAASRAASEAEAARRLREMNYGNYITFIPEGTSQLRISIVQFALQFVGWLPYVTGGNSLTTGADCSGFLQAGYAQFGIYLAHYSYTIARTGTKVVGGINAARPGDIICYRTFSGGGHVTMLIGWNYDGEAMMVHAPDVGWTITVSKAYSDGLHTVQNVIGD